MKYAYINPYFKNNEESILDQSASNDQLKYLKKISSVPYLPEDSKKKKNVKFLSQEKVLFSQKNVLSSNEINEDGSKKKGK